MIDALLAIAEGVAAFGTFVLWGAETCVNALLAAVVAAYALAMTLLPGMSDAPALGSPTWLKWLNWFFPVGDLLGILTGLVVMWLTFLAVRYLLRLVRGL